MLLGFRTGVLWKKILSVLYLVFCGLFLLLCLFEEKYVNLPQYDFNIKKLSNLILFLILISPYIFLSKTPFREKLILFKEYNVVKTTIGLVIVLFVLFIFLAIVDGCHSSEYKADMRNHNYVIEENIEPECEVDGNIKYICEFCGKSKNEIIPAMWHNLTEVKKTNASCEESGLIVEKCDRCDYTNEKEIAALGHQFVEVFRKEPTCDELGLLRKQCDRCKCETDEEVEALGHNLEEISKTDATCQKNGIIKYRCANCKYTEEKSIEKISHEMEVLEDTSNQIIKKCKYCDKQEIVEKSQQQTNTSTSDTWGKDISKIIGLSIAEAQEITKLEFRDLGVEQDGRTHYVAEHAWNGDIVAYTDSATHKICEVSTYSSSYNVLGVTTGDKTEKIQNVLNSNGWYLLHDSDTIYRKGNTFDGIFISNQSISYKENCLKPYLLETDTLNEYKKVLDTTEGACYIGNGQVLEYAYESIEDFMSYYADETDIRKQQIENYYKGLYLKIEGEIMDIYADGSIWLDLQGPVGQGVIEIVPQQYNWLNNLQKGDSLVVFAKLKGFTFYTLEMYDGIIFQYRSSESKMKSFANVSIPIITSVNEGIYVPLGNKVYDYLD